MLTAGRCQVAAARCSATATTTGRIETEFGVRAPIRVGRSAGTASRAPAPTTSATGGSGRGSVLLCGSRHRDVTAPVPAWRQAACLRTVHWPT